MLVLSMGAQWSVFQVFAWCNMVWKAAPRSGLLEAIADVQSGENPCKLCLAIQAAKANGRPAPVAPAESKMKLVIGTLEEVETRISPAEQPAAAFCRVPDSGVPAQVDRGVATPPPRLG
jgi:hypothetical protein